MKIDAFDDLYPMQLSTGATTLYVSDGSNSGVSGGDVTGEAGDLSVVKLRSSVSLSSNLGSGVLLGDVLTIIQASPATARFATPSNSISFGSNSTRVSEVSGAGAAVTAARADHLHDGIGTVTASASNTMQRGTLNLRPGSNVSFGLTDGDGDGEFDTLTINGSAAGGGSVSAGSNSTRVSEVSSAGVSTTLFSPFDHRHDGIGSITASSSNTMQRGTWNLRAGAGIALSLSDGDGDGELDTTTILNTATPAVLSGSYVGYNTAGSSWVTVTAFRQYCKAITLPSAAQMLSIDAYLRPAIDNVGGLTATVLTDTAGQPDKLIAMAWVTTAYLANSSSMPGAGRWLTFGVPIYLDPGTYWICIQSQNARVDLAYDGSGTDKYFTASQFVATGAYPSAWTITDTTNKYSIRARILS